MARKGRSSRGGTDSASRMPPRKRFKLTPIEDGPVERPTLTVDEVWCHSEKDKFTITTADHVTFHVPSYILLHCSGMFRDASEMCSDASVELELSDEDCETAAVLRLFLRFATEGPPDLSSDLGEIIPLAALLRKWECTAMRKNLRVIVQYALSTGMVDTDAVFILAAHEDDVVMAKQALEAESTLWPDGSVEGVSVNGARGEETTSPMYWPLRHWKIGIPAEYLFALTRARGEVGSMPNDRHELAVVFEKFLQEAKNPTS